MKKHRLVFKEIWKTADEVFFKSLQQKRESLARIMVKYKLKRCSNKECCKQCRYVMFKGTMKKWPVQKLAQGTTKKTLTTS